MKHRFRVHYRLEEARALIPWLDAKLGKLQQLRVSLEACQDQIESLLVEHRDIGGKTVNQALRLHAEFGEILAEFEARQLLLKDLERGLVDFPALVEGREVLLTWQQGSTDIDGWHQA